MRAVYIIAEMSANHGGSLDRALEIVHVAKDAGADCIKLQTYTADTITLKADTPPFIIEHGLWAGYTLHALYSKASTPWEWHGRIKAEAESIGIDFLSTPFDFTAVDFLEKLGVNAYKVASFEMVDIPLLRYIAQKGKPIFMSTGMGTQEEIQEAVDTIIAAGNNALTLLKCSSTYPADPAQMNLLTIPDMASRFRLPVGLSDHSLGHISALIAVALGACTIEKHICLSRKIETPDSEFSMEPKEFSDMVEHIRTAEKALGLALYGPIGDEKNSLYGRRSIFTSSDIKKGEVFSKYNIRVVRPSLGMHPREYDNIIGKRAACDILFATPLTMEMISE
ncbi:MAG: pseudaminic acid synthase [Oscillospiraceae bacterium]|nr:pseudaminic acid synthase [Oscillospiraceae bacterium]